MRCESRLWVLLTGALLAAGCTRSLPEAPEAALAEPDVMARWDGGEISAADFDAHLLSLPATERWPTESENATDWRRDRLDEIFVQRVYRDLAQTADLDEDDEFRAGWAVQRRSALAQAFFAREATDLEVTEDEARRYFARFGHEFDEPETRVLSNLLLAFPDDADDAIRATICARAETLRAEIEGGAAFAAVARSYSDSSTAVNGGLIGSVRREQLRGQAGEVIFSLASGEVSRVLQSAAGCQLFLVRQVAPAYKARFEGVLPQIMGRLREAKRTAAYLRLYQAEIARLGIEPPRWDESAGAAAFAADTLHFEANGERISGLDVLQRVRTGVPVPQALPQLASELILAAAHEREAPDAAAQLSAQARQSYARQYLERQAVQPMIEALPDGTLRQHFDRNATRFVTEPSVELTVASWPIGAGDPLRWLQRPRAFAAAVNANGGSTMGTWEEFAEDEGANLRSVPLTPLRALVEREPQLSPQLLGELKSGEVIGPFASNRRLMVLVVDSYIPSRPMGFVEAIDRVRLDYARQNAATLARQQLDNLKRERGFQLFEENLESFGARLLDKLLHPEAETSGDR